MISLMSLPEPQVGPFWGAVGWQTFVLASRPLPVRMIHLAGLYSVIALAHRFCRLRIVAVDRLTRPLVSLHLSIRECDVRSAATMSRSHVLRA